MTPARGTGWPSRRLNAPRGLNDPVCCSCSSLRMIRAEVPSAPGSTCTTGVERTYPLVRSYAYSTSAGTTGTARTLDVRQAGGGLRPGFRRGSVALGVAVSPQWVAAERPRLGKLERRRMRATAPCDGAVSSRMKPAASAAIAFPRLPCTIGSRAGHSIERLYRNARLKPALERPPTVQYVTIVPDLPAATSAGRRRRSSRRTGSARRRDRVCRPSRSGSRRPWSDTRRCRVRTCSPRSRRRRPAGRNRCERSRRASRPASSSVNLRSTDARRRWPVIR